MNQADKDKVIAALEYALSIGAMGKHAYQEAIAIMRGVATEPSEFELQPKDLLYADSGHSVHAMQPDMAQHIKDKCAAALSEVERLGQEQQPEFYNAARR